MSSLLAAQWCYHHEAEQVLAPLGAASAPIRLPLSTGVSGPETGPER
jgi:hypothetical protein